MYIDALLLLSDSQAITAATNSTNVIDLGNPDVKRRVGTGEAVGLGIFVEVAATGGPLTFNVIDSASSDLSSPTVLATVALTAAQMTAGAKFFIGIPPGQGRQRYLGMSESGTGTVTVSAAILPQRGFEEWTAYANAYAIRARRTTRRAGLPLEPLGIGSVPFTPGPAVPPVGRQPPPVAVVQAAYTPKSVRAVKAGYYGDRYRQVDDWFTIDNADFTRVWMASLADPTPVVMSLDPAGAVLGGPSLTLRVLGRGFAPDSTILWNGAPEPTTRVSSTELWTTVNMATATTAGPISVSVQALGGLTSAALTFTITEAAP